VLDATIGGYTVGSRGNVTWASKSVRIAGVTGGPRKFPDTRFARRYRSIIVVVATDAPLCRPNEAVARRVHWVWAATAAFGVDVQEIFSLPSQPQPRARPPGREGPARRTAPPCFQPALNPIFHATRQATEEAVSIVMAREDDEGLTT